MCTFVLKYDNLHWLPCGQIAKIAQENNLHGQLKCNHRTADIRSIISLFLLCAKIGDTLHLSINSADQKGMDKLYNYMNSL